jgi:hypothetical protein
MDKAEWPASMDPSLPEFMGPASNPVNVREIGVCPGYLVRLPAVIECVQARSALEHGALAQYVPGNEAAALDGAMLASSSFNAYEIEQIKNAGRDRE